MLALFLAHLQVMARALQRLDPASADLHDVQLTRNLIFSFIQLAQWPAAAQVHGGRIAAQ